MSKDLYIGRDMISDPFFSNFFILKYVQINITSIFLLIQGTSSLNVNIFHRQYFDCDFVIVYKTKNN